MQELEAISNVFHAKVTYCTLSMQQKEKQAKTVYSASLDFDLESIRYTLGTQCGRMWNNLIRAAASNSILWESTITSSPHILFRN